MFKFIIGCTSDKIWNHGDLLDFLIANQQGSIEITIEPEAVCLENLGLYQLLDKFSFEQVIIKTWNPLEQHPVYDIQYKGNNFWFNKLETIDPSLHVWNQHRLFYCLFGRPTASRLGLGGYLLTHYPTASHLHFSAVTDNDALMHCELDKLLTYRTASIAEAGVLIDKLPLLLGPSDQYTQCRGYVYTDPLTDLYRDIFVDILSESHVAGTTFFPTEKTIRPMWLKKPFIVFASKNYLDYLHQMGFRTFCDFWSEEYDGYEGQERFVRILKLIDQLAQTPIDKLEKMYWDMQYTLDYNYNLLLTQTYKKEITYIP